LVGWHEDPYPKDPTVIQPDHKPDKFIWGGNGNVA
jgi:hypothetical protein